MKRAVLLALLGAALAAGVGTGEGRERLDFADVALNVLPGGQATFGAHATDQLPIYDRLALQLGDVTTPELRRYFKPAGFGLVGRATRTQRPRPGLRILRDRWDTPHVYGRTRADVMFGAGWVTAEDRGLLIELLRYPGRLAALDAPGIDPFSLVGSSRRFVPSSASETVTAGAADLLRTKGPRGAQALRDIDAYLSGINGYNNANGIRVAPWTRSDVASIVAILGALFGASGGDEVRRSMFLDALQRRLGDERGRVVWDDLRERVDPETTVSVDGTFSTGSGAQSGPGNAVVDDGSFEPARPGAALRVAPPSMSNALLVTARRSATGRPLFVAGPQVGYFSPQLLLELDLHGGGIDARGVGVPGFAFVLVIGRGKDFAWSLTSADSDVVDQYVEVLCGDDTHYRYDGSCREMGTFDAGVLTGGGGPDERVVFRTTVHGPVVGYATVDGRRVAITKKRSTAERGFLSVLPFQALKENRVTSSASFLRAMGEFEFAFNALYADARDVAMYSAGRIPLRAPGVDSGLPTVGTGEYEWRGFLPAARHPQGVNPRSGVMVNWNNAPARGFAASDANWTFGSVQRVDLLARALAKRRKHTLASVVSAMNVAATQDLRNVEVLPVIADVLRTGPAPSARAARALEALLEWNRRGSSRLDRDLDGRIDHPGAAIMDQAWPKLTDAVIRPVLGPLTTRLASLIPRDEPPNNQGSAYQEGWFGYVDKDLRALLGRPVRAPFATRFCGAGDLAACRASLWQALDEAAGELAAAQGPDPEAWRANAAAERIVLAGFLPSTMRWVNRPTFQQVVTFTGHRSR